MATFFWNTPTLVLDGTRVACSANSVTVDASVDALDTTTFCSDGWRERIGGLFDAQIDIGGFWELTDVDADMWANLGAGKPFTVSEDETIGKTAYFNRALLSSENLGGSVGDVASRDLSLPGVGRLVRGVLLQPSDTDVSATGTSTPVEHVAAGGTESLYAVLHVVEAPGAGTLDVIVQSDDLVGFATPTTRVTFTTVTAARGSQWAVPIAGAISDTFYRLSYTLSAGTWKFAVAIGVAAS